MAKGTQLKKIIMKEKIIVIAVILAVFALMIVSVKYLPLWSSLICAVASFGAFVGGWNAKKWYDKHVNKK